MLTVIIIMTIGIILGYLLREKRAIFTYIDKTITYVIWLLLFFLGLSIGTNPTVMSNLNTLGIQAVAITIGTVTGSIIAVTLVARLIKTYEK